ncbi:aspartyl-phosphate phosphatase Spo0E family protein [Priestia koreensis]|uniref:aspartyl-phosphate phosphatase Spo0E family protein n=1 Tax=Priestia koreensis TaxID=284581 RepID=UPI001F55AC4A|nr:aspartyl-phosphate phosphatase Spo0E family protein [Priestia koreensis]MCM3006725.1 aspartyl-phosphate phosphatase Spo0E family protein [Priestia koreensis]UNL85175.1 aspartyl-phosphate phosphatase Spo0E family protein [Priestia koreensis]
MGIGEKLLAEIEKCRVAMIQSAAATSFSAENVVALSSQLDHLLNQYDRHMKEGY